MDLIKKWQPPHRRRRSDVKRRSLHVTAASQAEVATVAPKRAQKHVVFHHESDIVVETSRDEFFLKNIMHRKLYQRDWSGLDKILDGDDARKMALEELPFSGNDLALHFLCNYEIDLKKRAKIISALEYEKTKTSRVEAEKEARYQRRLKGEDIESSSSSDSDSYCSMSDNEDRTDREGNDRKLSNDVRDTDDESEEEDDDEEDNNFVPPASVILKLIQVAPEAACQAGFKGRLPLHNAIRLVHEPQVIEQLIKAYPEGIYVEDKLSKKPSHYLPEKKNENAVIHALLDRPLACWVHQFNSSEMMDNTDRQTDELEEEIKSLTAEYEHLCIQERQVEERLGSLDDLIEVYTKDGMHHRALFQRIVEMERILTKKTEKIGHELRVMIEIREEQVLEESYQRQISEGFYDDMKKVHEYSMSQLKELREELNMVKQNHT